MTFLNWLIFFLAASLTSALILAMVLVYRTQTWLTRIFSEKQGVPINTLEGKIEESVNVAHPLPRRKISVPLPGAEAFRKTQ
jgi:hypothetical protein